MGRWWFLETQRYVWSNEVAGLKLPNPIIVRIVLTYLNTVTAEDVIFHVPCNDEYFQNDPAVPTCFNDQNMPPNRDSWEYRDLWEYAHDASFKLKMKQALSTKNIGTV